MEGLERVLYVNLTDRTITEAKRRELFEAYLGGEGVASQLLLEESKPRIDPFSSDSPVIFVTGPLVGIYPCISKGVAMFKSPLTGNLGDSHCGGHFSTAMRFSGYGGIVIKGISEKPVILKVEDRDAKVEYASSLWGLSPLEVEEAIRLRKDEGVQSILSIGLAGENLVYYSGAVVDRYHHFGRLGLGAVLGSKKLKAIWIRGSQGIPLEKPHEVKAIYEEAHRKILETDLMRKYHDLGTPANVLELNELRALPTRNFSRTTFNGAEGISGETFAETLLERKISCPGCPVACIHLASLEMSFAPSHEKGRVELYKERFLVPYNYEPIFALGSNLEIGQATGVIRLISSCERLGMDAIMTGACLSWATEAFERGIIHDDELMGLKPTWGDVETYLQMIEHIANISNTFYARLAQGVASAAEKYGGKEFALSLARNSPAGYFTGYGSVVGFLVGARHSHLSNSGYSLDQRSNAKVMSDEEIVSFLINEEDWLCVLNSLVACYFSRRVYDPEIVVRMLASVGINIAEEDLKKLGKKIFHSMYRYKLQEGFDLRSQRIPKRLFETESPLGRLDPSRVQRLISKFIKMREKEGLKLRPETEALLELLAPPKSD
jgi:aldehyde:ferredoxin oxidoreductase